VCRSVPIRRHLRRISVDGCDALHNLRFSVRPKIALMAEESTSMQPHLIERFNFADGDGEVVYVRPRDLSGSPISCLCPSAHTSNHRRQRRCKGVL